MEVFIELEFEVVKLVFAKRPSCQSWLPFVSTFRYKGGASSRPSEQSSAGVVQLEVLPSFFLLSPTLPGPVTTPVVQGTAGQVQWKGLIQLRSSVPVTQGQ